MLTLYHWKPVATSLRVLIALHEKELEFESRYVDLLDYQQFGDDFLSLNPFAQVPVLINDYRPLYESVVINEFLEELVDRNPLVPKGPDSWYQQQCLTKYIDYNMTNSVATLGWWRSSRARLGELELDSLNTKVDAIPVVERREAWRAALAADAKIEQIENSERKLSMALERFEMALSQHAYLLGDAYSLADIAAFPMVRVLPDLMPERCCARTSPKVIDWLARVAEQPAVMAALATPVPEDGRPSYVPGPEHSRWG